MRDFVRSKKFAIGWSNAYGIGAKVMSLKGIIIDNLVCNWARVVVN